MKKIIFPAIIVILTCALYYNSLGNNFAYDDKIIILNNVHLKAFAENIPSFFSHKYFIISGENSYRPVTTLTYFINYQIWKLNPFGYHLFSVFLHIVNVLLLFLLLNKLFTNRNLSFLVCLIYLSHPILTEAVDCITLNEDILVSIFLILSFFLYLKFSENNKNKISFYLLSLFSFFLAMLSKESGIALLPVIFLYDFFITQNDSEGNLQTVKSDLKSFLTASVKKCRENKYVYFGYIAVSLFYLLLLFVVFKSPNNPASFTHNDLWTRIIYLPYNLFQFIKLSLWPFNLMNDYMFSYPEDFFSLNNILAYACVLGLIILSYFAYHRSKKIFFGIWWFVITLIPVLNIIEILNPIAERYLYVPVIGFSIVLGSFISEVPDKLFNKNIYKNGMKAFLILLLVFTYSYLTFHRNFVWKDDTSLCLDVISKAPNNYKAYYGLGYEYYLKGQLGESEKYFRRSIELRPDYSLSYDALGTVYSKQNKDEEAIIEYQKASKADPLSYMSCYNLGNIYGSMGETQKAIDQYKKAIGINPNFYDAYYNLGNIYLSREMYPDAMIQYQNAISLNGHISDAHFNLAMSYLKQNEMDKGLDELLLVIKLAPNEAAAYCRIGEIYTIKHDYDKAEKYLREGIKTNPDFSENYFNLGMVYAVQDKLDDAILQWEHTVRLDPNNSGAKNNIKLARKLKEDTLKNQSRK